MADNLDTLKSYPDDPTIVMSRRVVDDIMEEIERLRAELAALRENSLAVLTRVRAYRDKVITERDELRDLLKEATDKLQPISALVDMTPSGFPDHDICPIRLGMARDLRELRSRIDAALGGGDEKA